LQLFDSALQAITTPLIFLMGILVVFPLFKYFSISKKRGLALFFWHAFFSFVYALYVLNFGGDALHYYRASFNYEITPAFGTQGIVFFTSLFSVGLNLSLLGVFWVFHVFGVIGLLAFDGALTEVTANKSRRIRQLATLIIFLPSVSFWSSAIGKDSLSFMAMGLALWAALKLNRRVVLMVIAILIMLFVRPHMAGMMVIGLAGSMVFQRKTSIIQRVVFGVAALAATAVLVPFGLNYAGVGEDASSEDIASYIEGRQGENLKGGSSLDIASMNLPMKLFTYLFRPLPFEANSIFALLASVDNIILLFLFFAGIRATLKKKLPAQFTTHNRMFLWIYCFVAWFILASTTANLGIAMRQKWMFAPMLIFLLISLIGKERKTMTVANTDIVNKI
jgi:hypothetical protein